MIEEYAHSGLSQGASGSVLQYGANLFQSHTGEPFDELRDKCAVFQIFEQRCHGHACTTEDPGAAYTTRITLYGSAGRPVKHSKLYRTVNVSGAILAQLPRAGHGAQESDDFPLSE